MFKLRSSLSAASKTRLLLGFIITFTLVMLTYYFGQPRGFDPQWTENFSRRTWLFEVISDDDQRSKVDDKLLWKSKLKQGRLIRDDVLGTYSVSWEASNEVQSSLNDKGRAMELSLYIYFNNRYYSCDDRTGIVYEIRKKDGEIHSYPRQVLVDGDGTGDKAFKCEWATVKGNDLIIGSFGKEFTNDEGEILNENPMWIKKISKSGSVTSENWSHVYNKLRELTGTTYPGYLFHEAIIWNESLKRWFILPRRVSKEKYNPKLDEQRGSDLMISLNEQFEDPEIARVGTNLLETPSHGFSAFKFVPGRPTEILAVRSEEVDDKTASYLIAFNIEGQVLMEETLIELGHKYEGIEFLH